MTQQPKTLPYSRQVAELARSGAVFRPDYLYVLTGPEAWDEKNILDANRPGCAYVMLPHDGHPDEYNWDIARKFDMAFIITSQIGDTTLKIAAHCLLLGCRLVLAGTYERDQWGFHKHVHSYWPQRVQVAVA